MGEFYGSIHCHTDMSNFRLRDSTNRLKELCWYAARDLHHDFIAITDHETIASSIECQDVEAEIRKEFPNFKIVRGNEIYLCRNDLTSETVQKGEKYYHWILLAKDEIGHNQIRKLSSRAWSHSFKTGKMIRVPTYYSDLQEIIGKDKGHVIMSSACLGSKPSQLLLDFNKEPTNEKWDYIKNWIINISEICGKENFFLETQPSFNKEQIIVNKLYKKLSDELDIPVIITLDAHYLKKDDEEIHRAFLTSQDGDRETKDFYASTYMMSTEEIHSYMDETIGKETVSKWLNNTKLIYNMCEDYDLTKPTRIVYIPKTIDSITVNEFNHYKDKIKELEYFYNSPHKENQHLAAAIVRKIIKEPQEFDNIETFEMIDDNLKAIRLASEKMNTQWSAYLLNLRDYVNIIWEQGNSLMGPARGSGTGFLLLYMLGVTQINPLKETTKTYSFRFLNPERVSPLDVDLDIEGGKRPQVYAALQKAYGEDRVSKVLTIRTEATKSAILTAMRGLGYDPDEAAYISSFIKSDRGQQRTLHQTYYGDPENDIAPDLKFKELMDGKYNDVWKVANYIQGLCSGVGSHAGGVIFYDSPITDYTALMQTTNGDIITQYDLHTIERVSCLKIDLLSIEALDRMRACIDLLVKNGYINGENRTLREIYNEAIAVYNLERNDKKMWDLINSHKVQALFQMEQQSGIKGIEAVKPESLDDLAALNAVIRLMAPEKGAEQPINKFARFKSDINFWYDEMREWNVDEKYWSILEEILLITYGMCIQQEQFMMLVQREELGGFSLLWADKLRKSIAKKDPRGYEELTKEFFEVTKEKGCDENLCKYVWLNLIALNKGYGFNAAHTLAYSIVALQELNLCYKYPMIFWNTANLIVDSGSMNLEEEFSFDDDNEDENKIKNSSTNYGRIAAAMGKMKANGISFTLPNINKSDITYIPDIENNLIISGMRGIQRIGNQLIKDIIKNRPYTSIEDFLRKVKVDKVQMINLIKAGVFDSLYEDKNRNQIMDTYILSIADQKRVVNLRNMQMLITKDLIPLELDFEKRVFNFNQYLKHFKEGNNYRLDEIALAFFKNNYSENVLTNIEIIDGKETALINADLWNRTYNKEMDTIRKWMKSNQTDILEKLNNKLYQETAEKYTDGSISKWEMDSLSFYYHEHELGKLKKEIYNISDFNKISKEPEIENSIPTKNGGQIEIFKIYRICGTVIDKNKNKGEVSLLTPTGVVTVKIWKNQFTVWDKRISKRNADGTKTVIEESWFKRGTKLIITGFRRDDCFVPKKYKNTPFELFEKIIELDDKGFIINSTTVRAEGE